MSVAQTVGLYFMKSMGASMIYLYFSEFIGYILCILIAWAIAVRSDYQELRFIVTYEFAVLGINILRKSALIVLKLVNDEHVSLSLYCWIVIFVAGIVLFSFTYKIRKREETKIV